MLFKVERDRAAFLEALRARDVLMVEYPHGQVRAVTHYGVDAADIDTTHRRDARGPRRDRPGRPPESPSAPDPPACPPALPDQPAAPPSDRPSHEDS